MKVEQFEAIDKILREQNRADLAEELLIFANQVAQLSERHTALTKQVNEFTKTPAQDSQGEFRTSRKKKIQKSDD